MDEKRKIHSGRTRGGMHLAAAAAAAARRSALSSNGVAYIYRGVPVLLVFIKYVIIICFLGARAAEPQRFLLRALFSLLVIAAGKK